MRDCKHTILSTIPDNNCCSHAFMHVILTLISSINEKNSSIQINSKPEILNKVTKIIKNFYPDITLESGNNFLILRGNIFALLLDSNYSSPTISSFSNDCDKLTLLKTIFILCGNFYYNQDSSVNSKGYNLEFVIKSESFAEQTMDLLKEFGFDLKHTTRQNNHIIYTKNSNIICDLFVKLGDVSSALDIQNNLAIREIRNSANRQNNCFEFNLDKTINASNEQLTAINYIINNYSLDYLDENLKEVALARIANPDVSLNDLRIILNNKISRAGIKYRLDKIINMYKKLKGDE